MQATKPDSRIFASYPMPAKIDLLNEKPRRESLVEQQLGHQIGRISPGVPRITVNEQVTTTTTNSSDNNSALQPFGTWTDSMTANNCQQSVSHSHSPTGHSEVKETRIVINRHSSPICSTSPNNSGTNQHYEQQNVNTTTQQQQQQMTQQLRYEQQQQQFQQPSQRQPQPRLQSLPPVSPILSGHQQRSDTNMSVTTTTTSTNKVMLENELAEKEVMLMREIDALNQRPYSPFHSPDKVNLQSGHTHQQLATDQFNQSPRPLSSASSTGADLLDKEAKLLKEIEEIESKPFNPQTMVVERENWYEYPENRPGDRHLTDSRHRVRDFCTMPTSSCQDRHLHEENLPIKGQSSPTPGSIHTTIIRSPKREIDNKSPLPFAFDNFTTKGVRGNIATVGAVEPDRPRPPIFPIVRRTPSPAFISH